VPAVSAAAPRDPMNVITGCATCSGTGVPPTGCHPRPRTWPASRDATAALTSQRCRPPPAPKRVGCNRLFGHHKSFERPPVRQPRCCRVCSRSLPLNIKCLRHFLAPMVRSALALIPAGFLALAQAKSWKRCLDPERIKIRHRSSRSARLLPVQERHFQLPEVLRIGQEVPLPCWNCRCSSCCSDTGLTLRAELALVRVGTGYFVLDVVSRSSSTG